MNGYPQQRLNLIWRWARLKLGKLVKTRFDVLWIAVGLIAALLSLSGFFFFGLLFSIDPVFHQFLDRAFFLNEAVRVAFIVSASAILGKLVNYALERYLLHSNAVLKPMRWLSHLTGQNLLNYLKLFRRRAKRSRTVVSGLLGFLVFSEFYFIEPVSRYAPIALLLTAALISMVVFVGELGELVFVKKSLLAISSHRLVRPVLVSLGLSLCGVSFTVGILKSNERTNHAELVVIQPIDVIGRVIATTSDGILIRPVPENMSFRPACGPDFCFVTWSAIESIRHYPYFVDPG